MLFASHREPKQALLYLPLLTVAGCVLIATNPFALVTALLRTISSPQRRLGPMFLVNQMAPEMKTAMDLSLRWHDGYGGGKRTGEF